MLDSLESTLTRDTGNSFLGIHSCKLKTLGLGLQQMSTRHAVTWRRTRGQQLDIQKQGAWKEKRCGIAWHKFALGYIYGWWSQPWRQQAAEEHFTAGALFDASFQNIGVRTAADAPLTLLGEFTENKSMPLNTSAIMGIGLAYADSHRKGLLRHHVAEDTVSMQITCGRRRTMTLPTVTKTVTIARMRTMLFQTRMSMPEEAAGAEAPRALANPAIVPALLKGSRLESSSGRPG
ncbi:hypothetical protein FPV67DRAFT_1669289 [Lyophyllum atratum]|nr:hypothetical protein FPV67DRAFT_1669289 [Lyophyllum atratum]